MNKLTKEEKEFLREKINFPPEDRNEAIKKLMKQSNLWQSKKMTWRNPSHFLTNRQFYFFVVPSLLLIITLLNVYGGDSTIIFVGLGYLLCFYMGALMNYLDNFKFFAVLIPLHIIAASIVSGLVDFESVNLIYYNAVPITLYILGVVAGVLYPKFFPSKSE